MHCTRVANDGTRVRPGPGGSTGAASADVAASRGLVDDVIDPADTRRYIAMQLEILVNKRELRPAKKHGLGPV